MNTVKEPSRRANYRIEVSEEGAEIQFGQDFWDATVIRRDGTTSLDRNVATILDEFKIALYYVASLRLVRH